MFIDLKGDDFKVGHVWIKNIKYWNVGKVTKKLPRQFMNAYLMKSSYF
jgi:hypothetical protein